MVVVFVCEKIQLYSQMWFVLLNFKKVKVGCIKKYKVRLKL